MERSSQSDVCVNCQRNETEIPLLRFRFHIEKQGSRDGSVPLLAEEAVVAGFTGLPSEPQWLAEEEAEELLQIEPDANVNPGQATRFLERIVAELPNMQDELAVLADGRAQELLAAHERVRAAARAKGLQREVRAQTPVDVLGVYLLLPA